MRQNENGRTVCVRTFFPAWLLTPLSNLARLSVCWATMSPFFPVMNGARISSPTLRCASQRKLYINVEALKLRTRERESLSTSGGRKLTFALLTRRRRAHLTRRCFLFFFSKKSVLFSRFFILNFLQAPIKRYIIERDWKNDPTCFFLKKGGFKNTRRWNCFFSSPNTLFASAQFPLFFFIPSPLC